MKKLSELEEALENSRRELQAAHDETDKLYKGGFPILILRS